MAGSKSEIQFYPESSFESAYAAIGVLSNVSIKSSSNNNQDQKHNDYLSIDRLIHDNQETSEKKPKWTKKQWLILITSMLGNFGCAVCVSLQAPFFPAEAQKKGVTPTVYGFVFSAFSLTVFLLAPFFGKYIEKIGARFLMNSGIFVTSFCCILFGFLDKIHSRSSFITFAFLVRIVEAMGDAAFHTANFTKLPATFPNDIGKTFAFLRAAFGMGLIVGPTIGGVLYEVGGYTLPFASMGGFLMLICIFSTILFWDEPDDMKSEHSDSNIAKALLIPSVALSMVAVCFGALSIGFLNATLEPHLRQFNLNSIQVGLMFVISGGVYALCSVFWGWLCDGKVPPKILISIGASLICVTYMLIGPPPFMPFGSSLVLCIIGLVFHGLGMGAELLASHIDALKKTILHGYPESYETYGMISGFWAAFFQLGNFIGPSIGGILYDQVGFRNATLVLISLQLILVVTNLVFYIVFDYRSTKKQQTSDTEKSPLLHKI